MIMDKRQQSPPDYADSTGELPFSYPVGSHNVQPFVTLTELQSHLRLLGAFAKLKENVLSVAGDGPSSDVECAWVVYVNRSVHRFNKFMGGNWPKEFPGWMEQTTPPIDVLMVLHAYMLNPTVFHEDTVRRTSFFSRNLAAIKYFPVRLVASLIDPVSLEALPPTPDREAHFYELVNEPFVLPLQTKSTDVVTINCPCCDTLINSAPWITEDDKGFAQPSFSFGCPECKKEFTKSMMGVRRFADEMTRQRANRRVYFAETLIILSSGKADDSVADMFHVRLLRRLVKVCSLKAPCEQDKIGEEGRRLAANLQWDLDVLAEHLLGGLRPTVKFDANDFSPRVRRIVAAYSIPGTAGIDLVGAVLRQSVFTEQVDVLGWSKPGYFNEDQKQASLIRAIARYHAFLDLLSQSNDFFVPTMDIDLVWHTHQLSGEKYRVDTLQAIGRIPNHDDAIEQTVLQKGFDDTAKAWKARFGVPLTVCGCMPDSAPEAKKKSKGGFSKLLKFGPAHPNAGIVGPRKVERQVGAYPDLVTTDPSDADFFHPSDHNMHREEHKDTSVQAEAISRELASKDRASKILSPQTEPVDQWRKLQADRKQNRPSHREAFTGPDDTARFPYWAKAAKVPPGFYAASKYDNTEEAESQYTEMGLGRDSNWMPSMPYA